MKKNIEILIVEDSKTQAEELRYFLETNNYKVQYANDGEEALASVKKSQELDKTNRELALTQLKLNELNKNLEDEVKVRTERIEHLNTVLRAIRKINQLIVQEKDRETLIKKVCENFVEIRDFQSAWIVLLDDDDDIIDFAREDGNIDISKPDKKFIRDYIPYCLKETLKTDDIVLIDNVETNCKDCLWLKLHKEGEWGAMSMCLKSGGKCYGVINILLPAHYVIDKEEQSLFIEVAENIAFALYGMELEEKHKQVEGKYSVMFEKAKDAIFLSDETGKFVDVNQLACESLGYSKKELMKLSNKEIDADPRGYEAFLKIRNGEDEQGVFEVNQRRKDGTFLPVEITGSFFTSGVQQIAVAIARDITERKLMEEQFRLIAENTSDVISLQTFDLKASYTYISPSIKAMNGYEPEEMLGRSAFEFIHPDDRKNLLPLLKKYVNFKIKNLLTVKEFSFTETIEFRGKNKSGNWLHFQSTSNVIGNQLLFVTRNITERKKAEANLITALQKAEENDRLKTAFLQNVSHEIRTPMNGILGFANLLSEPGLTGEEQHKYIDIIKVSGDRMLNTINDLMNISMIESGQVNVSVSEVNINEQTNDLYTFFKPEANEKKLQIICKNSLPEQEAIIKTDKDKLYSVLTNLIKNAIKYSNDGIIEFGYKKKGEYLEYFVKDAGIGISKDNQQAVFDRFVQAYIGEKRVYEGSGLGLSISKAYVEMLGGKIWVKSEEGIGSQFYFTIPYHTAEKETIAIQLH